MCQTEVVEKSNTHLMFSNLFPKIVTCSVEKYGTAIHATDSSIMRLCDYLLDN